MTQQSLNSNLYAVFLKEVDNFLCSVMIQATVHQLLLSSL